MANIKSLWFYLKDLDRVNRKCYFLKVVQVQEKVSIETEQQELIVLVTTGWEAQRLTVQDGGHAHIHLHINVNNPLTPSKLYLDYSNHLCPCF